MNEFIVCYLILGGAIATAGMLSPAWEEMEEAMDYTALDWWGTFMLGVLIWPLLVYWMLTPGEGG